MAKIEPRWNDINVGVLVGLERILATQQVLVMQARATVKALDVLGLNLVRQDGEEQQVFEARKNKNQLAVATTTQDLEVKEAVLAQLRDEYLSFLEDGPDFLDCGGPLDTSILEDPDDEKRPKRCSC